MAFIAHRSKAATGDNPSLATGQVQVNRRSTNADAGTGPAKFHGIVDCLVVNGGRSVGDAYISGHRRGAPTQRFELRVTDGGRGQAERGGDMIALFAPGETDQGDPGQADDAEGPCGFAEEPATVALFRGNVQTWNASTSDDDTAPAPADDAQTAAALTTASSLVP
ncbi:MAG TPA: hypothetical protein VNB64_13150 [Solirubrobacteraceae bacterium]|nr:hypothetical protein [Solirubrobacteraceae bacterium]